MLDDPARLLSIVLFGAVGFGYFRYGRKQQHLIASLCGIGLMVYPYLIHGMFWLVVLGLVMMAGPFVIRS